MRVNLTRILDKGLKRRSPAAPETVDLALKVDDGARRVLVAYYPDRSATSIPVFGRLVYPQLADMKPRSFVMHGYEADRQTGQLFAQAWELEPVRGR